LTAISREEIKKRVLWTVADLTRQIEGWETADVSLVHSDSVTTITLSGDAADPSIVLQAEKSEDPAVALHLTCTISDTTLSLRWAPTVSVWLCTETGHDLYAFINQHLTARGIDHQLSSPDILNLTGLKTYFHTEQGIVKAVDGLTVQIKPGQTLGLVGESGSGKSVTSLSVMGLLPEFTARIPEGDVVFMGRDLLTLTKREYSEIRGSDIAMIFQEPMTSLNPVFRVGDQISEAIIAHESVSRSEAKRRTIELMGEVGIPDPAIRVKSYPHEMSGGQKQRIMIAMALACNPQLLIADEPTTALDVTIQKQILELLADLRDSRGMSILFITHDLGVIAEIADYVAVMYRGKLCEYGTVLSVFEDPKHPYTRGLLACRPRLDTRYRLLPTVADFLDTWVEDGEIRTAERTISDERELELMEGVRDKMPVGEGNPVLSVTNLHVWFPLKKTLLGKVEKWVKAVDGISFDVYKGQTLGLVGESGCGKTTTGRAILHLTKPKSGRVNFEGQSLDVLANAGSTLKTVCYALSSICFLFAVMFLGGFLYRAMEYGVDGTAVCPALVGIVAFTCAVVLSGVALSQIAPEERAIRQRLQIIFQDPYASLNPRLTIQQTLTEPMIVHKIGKSSAERVQKAGDLLEEVGLPREYLRRFPHEFSGGQRQRICIARTLALEPSMIICDESVSALDVSVQAQVLNLLKQLQKKYGLTYIFISHDLSVVKFMSDVMAVMKDGKIVEIGPSDHIYESPSEEYTRELISAIPKDDLEHIRALTEARKSARKTRRSLALTGS